MEGGFFPEPASASPQQVSWPANPPPQSRQRQQQQLGPVPPLGRATAGAAAAAAWAPPVDADQLDEYPGASQGGCSHCPSVSFNSEWLRAFGVVLCNQCRRQETLISKSTAKQRYSVSDGDLRQLGSLRKSNPHKKDWQAMHLYLESQVARLAHDKHGGAEGLEEHQQAKLDAKLQAKLRRREEEKRKEQAEEQRLQRIRQRIACEEQQQQAAAAAAASDSEVEEI